jgi:NAD(P)-dependent dehydrogenase (short-subunit alcohol dehydrogenase family)
MIIDLSGQIALVTGAGSGIGRAIALAMADAGATVVVTDVDVATGSETVGMIKRKGGRALFLECDVTDPAAHDHVVDETLSQFGRLDIACNNAGISGSLTPIDELGPDDWRRVIDINLNGVFFGMRSQLRAMAAQKSGAIVNIASIFGAVSFRGAPAYTAAKHGVLGLTKNAALDYSGRGIRVNAVMPGVITTPLTSVSSEGDWAPLIALHPIGRLGVPDEVAAAVVWLSSGQASFVTGACLPVDGGYLAQ